MNFDDPPKESWLNTKETVKKKHLLAIVGLWFVIGFGTYYLLLG